METAVFKFKVDLASVNLDTYTWKLSTTVAIDVQNNIKLLLVEQAVSNLQNQSLMKMGTTLQKNLSKKKITRTF